MINSRFTPTSKMNELLKEDPSLLLTMTRFGIALGFGDKSVKEVCRERGVDMNTFLAVVNFICGDQSVKNLSFDGISISSLIVYLKNAHEFFLDFKLPLIRRKLLDAIGESVPEQPYRDMILRFFDQYVAEVEKHMIYENDTVFPYVMKLIEGEKNSNFNIGIFEQNHDNIDSKLSDLKNILIRYFPAREPNYLLNEVLFDLSDCEVDLERHTLVEDHFFVPAAERIERKFSVEKPAPEVEKNESVLTEREREVLVCVVKGLTNKEIAAELFLSTHTIISHRRNIARKLEIHSTAGLTIYAIVNNLVTLEEIKSVIG
jgi:regulator of cell morphogenesis and NO signaling